MTERRSWTPSPIVTAYTEGFNTLDKRSAFTFTEEREHIYVAVDEKRRATDGTPAEPLNREALASVFDSLRDF